MLRLQQIPSLVREHAIAVRYESLSMTIAAVEQIPVRSKSRQSLFADMPTGF